MENIIPIVLISDDNYVMPASVCITSLIENKKDESNYEIHYFGIEISQQNSKIISSMQKENCKIQVHNLENKYKNNTSDHTYVTKAALFKFDIQDILTQFDKVIYIDPDTIVTTDLSDLYNTDVTDVYAGVVNDMFAMKVKQEHLNFHTENFFNSGMMLLNCQKLRQDNMYEKLLKTNTRIKDIYVDNATFVVTFGEKVKYLTPKYNYMNPISYFTNKDFYDFYKDDIFDTDYPPPPEELAIIHYTAPKPWQNSCTYYWKEWAKYFKQSPFKNEKVESLKFRIFKKEKSKRMRCFTILGKKVWLKK